MQALFRRLWNVDSSTSSRLMNAAAVILMVWSLAALWLQRVAPRNAPLPTRRAAPPLPFFDADADVLDLYEGNGAERDALAPLAEIVVVMFYAPWSLHSLEARTVFRQAADAFHQSNTSAVRFVAVNCNDHRGDCRRAYKLYSYPVIFAYVANNLMVVFDRPLAINVLLDWISHLRRPYSHIIYEDEWANFVGGSDYSVVGFVAPLAADGRVNRMFKVFHAAAAKSSVLPMAVSFATVRNVVLAERWSLAPNQLRLYANFDDRRPAAVLSTLTLDSAHAKSDGVLQWIRDAVAPIAWRTVERIGFENDGSDGKALFNKINATDATLVLFTSDLDAIHTTSFTHLQLKTLAAAFHDCSMDENAVDGISTLSNFTKASNFSTAFRAKDDWRQDFRGLSCRVNRTVGFVVMDRRHADFFIWRWKLWSNYELLSRFGSDFNSSGNVDVNEECKDLAVLVSNVDEQFFWLTSGDVSVAPMSRLITEFSTERLSPNRPVLVATVSPNSTVQPPLTSFSVLDEDDEGKTENENNGRIGDYTVSVLRRITVAEFLSNILGQRHDFDAFVFISGGRWSGPSQHASHILHTVVDYFRAHDRLIKFFILDASKNQLPWQYTFETLPAFVFFSAGRLMESVAFPSADFPLTVPNLMAFLLAHAQPSLRFRLALGVCGAKCLSRNSDRLQAFVRRSDVAIRSARRALRHQRHAHPTLNGRLRTLLRRHITQRHVARHLLGVIDALLSDKRRYGEMTASGNDTTLQHLTKDLMLLRWILKSHSADLQE